MPITDPFKAALAKRHRLYMKICRKCGARNAKRLPVKLKED